MQPNEPLLRKGVLMPADEDKRAAQLNFMAAENVRIFYQQIISKGYIEVEGESLTQQVTQDRLPEMKQPEIEQEIGLEPER
jgi:riboflavin synthase alpha subunit